jgi:hypothetical protein
MKTPHESLNFAAQFRNLGLTDAGLARWLSAVYALNPPSIIKLAPVM